MSETNELAEKLNRRNKLNEGEEVPVQKKVKESIYSEFKEFSIQDIQRHKKFFDEYDSKHSGVLDLPILKYMMEKLGEPQTHLGLKAMIREVDEDNDGFITFRGFLLIFRKARAGELVCDGLKKLVQMTEVDVSEVGVKGAIGFFSNKADALAQKNKFEDEIREEQERKRKKSEETAEGKRRIRAQIDNFEHGPEPADGRIDE